MPTKNEIFNYDPAMAELLHERKSQISPKQLPDRLGPDFPVAEYPVPWEIGAERGNGHLDLVAANGAYVAHIYCWDESDYETLGAKLLTINEGTLRTATCELPIGVNVILWQKDDLAAGETIVRGANCPITLKLEVTMNQAAKTALWARVKLRSLVEQLTLSPMRDFSGGGLTFDELVIALRNIGYDLTCGRCAAVIYTSMPSGEHDATCTTNKAVAS